MSLCNLLLAELSAHKGRLLDKHSYLRVRRLELEHIKQQLLRSANGDRQAEKRHRSQFSLRHSGVAGPLKDLPGGKTKKKGKENMNMRTVALLEMILSLLTRFQLFQQITIKEADSMCSHLAKFTLIGASLDQQFVHLRLFLKYFTSKVQNDASFRGIYDQKINDVVLKHARAQAREE